MDFALPELGEGVYEAELLHWRVKPGDKVAHGQTLIEVMTDKATMEVPSPFQGTITELKAKTGTQINVGSVILTYAGTALAKPAAAMTPATTVAASAGQHTNGTPIVSTSTSVKAAPSIRYLARKMGIDLAAIHGTGPGGRILHEDLSALLSAQSTQRPAATRSAPRIDVGTPGVRLKMQGMRRRMAEHMVAAKKAIPHFSYIDECDITDLVRLRAQTLDLFAQNNVKLTYLTFFVQAAIRALKEVPIVNAMLDEQAHEVVVHDHYHIGIAVATPSGLVVPVIRDADKKSVLELAREIERLSLEARAGKSKREDLGGSTFTITSIGGMGGLIATPIINHPEVAILGIGKVVKRPVYDEHGNVKPADMVYLSMSFDHRVIDGAIATVFGNALIKHLKTPAALLLPAQF
jgi:pyruvate dehydrogenase E2 component (dihydrolipoamide acetyltransferase)/2-oxoisovalerate dehydrogenase E2 component (dihydrolipoyl transacylase)